jgi:hypothetical protein
VRVTAHDAAANSAADASDLAFTIGEGVTAVAEPLLDAKDVLGVYPNPAPIGGAHILYRLPNAGPADVAIYDMTGRVVRRLVAGSLPSGVRSVGWDGRDENGLPVGAGNYFVRLVAGAGVTATKRLTLVR